MPASDPHNNNDSNSTIVIADFHIKKNEISEMLIKLK